MALAPKSKAEEMVKSGSFQYTNVMDIVQMAKKDMKKEEEEEKELVALCLKPFHNEFNRAIWFVEFVEYYRLMGERRRPKSDFPIFQLCHFFFLFCCSCRNCFCC